MGVPSIVATLIQKQELKLLMISLNDKNQFIVIPTSVEESQDHK